MNETLGKESDIIPIEQMASIVLEECRNKWDDTEIITEKIIKQCFVTTNQDLIKNSNKFINNNIKNIISYYRKKSTNLEYVCKTIKEELNRNELIEKPTKWKNPWSVEWSL